MDVKSAVSVLYRCGAGRRTVKLAMLRSQHLLGPLASTILAIVASLSLSCSSEPVNAQAASKDDGGHEEQGACASFVKLLTRCGVLTGTHLARCDDDSPVLSCLIECVSNASCDEVAGSYCYSGRNGFSDCATACEPPPPPPEFLCGDGSVIEASWRCDGATDCPDGEDEDCPAGVFTCKNGGSIPAGWQCDRVADCPGGEDELDCGGAAFTCGNGASLPPSRECDGITDCPGGEDEFDCTRLLCE